MSERPTLETKRLQLRPFTLEDASSVQQLAGDRAIADTTQFIPHPYENGMAEKWIGTHQEEFEKGNQVVFAIALRQGNYLIGAMGLSSIDNEHDYAALGYWIGKPYWNQGFCTEAGRAVLNYGFEQLNLNRIYAEHFMRNPASGRVMQKLGMTHEGCLRQHIKKWGHYEDVEVYGILKKEFYRLR